MTLSAAEQREIARHVGAEEAGRLLLVDHDVARSRRDVGHDLVAVEVGDHGLVADILGGTVVLPRPASGVPEVAAAHAGGVDHRQTLGAGLVDQGADVGQRDPGVLAAGIAPLLDGFQDRLRLVAAERVVDVDDEQRRALAEALPRPIARGPEHRLVALGEKLVPDRFAHLLPPKVVRHSGAVRRAGRNPKSRMCGKAVAGFRVRCCAPPRNDAGLRDGYCQRLHLQRRPHRLRRSSCR